MKFNFKVTFPHGGTMELEDFEADTLYEVLEDFTMFLRGCGFSIDGHLDIVEDEIYEPEF